MTKQAKKYKNIVKIENEEKRAQIRALKSLLRFDCSNQDRIILDTILDIEEQLQGVSQEDTDYNI